MISVHLPRQIAVEAGIPVETAGGETASVDRGPGIEVLVDIVGTVADVIAVVDLGTRLPDLARALRRWVHRLPPGARGSTVTVRRNGVEERFDLPPNVPVEDIVRALEEAIQKD